MGGKIINRVRERQCMAQYAKMVEASEAARIQAQELREKHAERIARAEHNGFVISAAISAAFHGVRVDVEGLLR